MKVLELFKGSGSIGKYCKDKHDVVSLDIDRKSEADKTIDILEWDYASEYPVGYFDVVWGSPPCTEYSHLLHALPNRVRDLNLADSIVLKTLEIIGYFQPKYWFIENPQSGLLKSRNFMDGLPFYDVSYCKYGYDYRKHTRIWTNLENFDAKVCKKDCGKMVGRRHIKNLGRSEFGNMVHDLNQRYSIPPLLVQSLFEHIC